MQHDADYTRQFQYGVLAMSRKGYPRSPSVESTIRAEILALRAAVERDPYQVEPETILNHLRLRQWESLLAPVRRLPPELLVRIFILLEDDLVSAGAPRAVVGCVCKLWRTVSRSTSSLWSSIRIEVIKTVTSGYKTSEEPNTSFLDQCLALSYPQPLSIFLRINLYSLQQRPLALLADNCLRWRNLVCHGSQQAIEYFLTPLCPKLPMLERLQLAYKHFSAGVVPESIILPPSLLHLALNAYSPHITLRWSTLVSLAIGFDSPLVCYDVLRQTTNLVHLSLTHLAYEEPGHSSQSRLTPIELGSLLELELSPCAAQDVIELFRFPHLDSLLLHKSFDKEKYHTHLDEDYGCDDCSGPATMIKRVHTMLKLSKCSLRALKIEWDVNLEDCPIFRLCRSVTILSVHFWAQVIERHVQAIVFLDSLVVKAGESATPTSTLFPCLMDLEIRFSDAFDGTSSRYTHGVYTSKSIEEVLISRSKEPSVAQIARFSLLSLGEDWPEEDPLQHQRYATCALSWFLQSLAVNEGVNVSWMLGDVDVLERGRQYLSTIR